MRDLLKLISAPGAAIALAVLLGIAGGMENGTIPFPAALLITVVIVAAEAIAIKTVISRERAREDGENEKR